MNNLQKLESILAKLRSKDGCPWDKEQTHESLKRNLLEESYELLEAIEHADFENMKEELGDVLLQVFFHSQIASENKKFDIDDVACGICEKLIRRHPHVFSDEHLDTADEVVNRWEEIKKTEKSSNSTNSVMDGVILAQPALMAAQQISKKAVKVGFEWDCYKTLRECFLSELNEFEEEVQKDDKKGMEDEIGDMLFALVNIARWHKIDAEQALRHANLKFIKRFKMMEKLAQKPLCEYNFKEYDMLWKEAKKAFSEGDF